MTLPTWQDLHFRRIAKSKAPIVVGPFRTEVGFESLYWLPWLAGFREKYHIPKERIVAISRGGAACWYDAGHQVELYDYSPPDKIRKAMLADAKQTGSVKQVGISSWENTLLPVIAQDLGIRKYHLLHPSLMYRELAPYWDGALGSAASLKRLVFGPMPFGQAPLSLPLPEKYVAIRFYARHTWPLSEELRTWVCTYVENLAKHVPVVLLSCNLHVDDHLDFPISGPNILDLTGHVTLQNNLAVQSAVIAKSQAFIGTYGGTMQLAVRLKKPAIGFFQKFEGTCYAHKQLTEWLAVQQGTPCFIGRPDDARFVKEATQFI